MSTLALSHLRSKLFPKSSPNPNECTHERNRSTCRLIHESQRLKKTNKRLILNNVRRDVFPHQDLVFPHQNFSIPPNEVSALSTKSKRLDDWTKKWLLAPINLKAWSKIVPNNCSEALFFFFVFS